jgi:putative transposase
MNLGVLTDQKMMEIMDKHMVDHPTERVISRVLFYIAKKLSGRPNAYPAVIRIMGRKTNYRRKSLAKQGMKVFIKPYLRNGLEITHLNQVWSTVNTYILMLSRFMCLTSINDLCSRKIVG